MRKPKFTGFTLPEFAATVAALAIIAAVLHPVLVQARTSSKKLSTFHHDAAFQMYAVDVDGGFGDFEGKPVLLDRLGPTLALYGGHRAGAHAKKGAGHMTGCMPILRFEPSSYVAATGSLTYWEGKVGSATAGCSIYPATTNDSVLLLPDWGDVPTDSSGNFWLVAGAMQQGVGTIGIETNTGATAADSVLVIG